VQLDDKVKVRVGSITKEGKVVGISDDIVVIQLGNTNHSIVIAVSEPAPSAQAEKEPEDNSKKKKKKYRLKTVDDEGRELLYD